MRIMLHDNYEKKLLDLTVKLGLSPSAVIKKLINQECTIDAQGWVYENSGTSGKEKEL